jgi:hypothetical protein
MGQALGAAGQAGMQGYSEAQTSDLNEKIKQAQLAKMQQEVASQQAMGGVDMNNPESLRRYGILTKKPEFITHAERIEKKQAQDQELAGMKSQTAVIPPDPQEVAQSQDTGAPPPAPAVVKKGGIFGPLQNAPFQDIADEARTRQEEVDNAKLRDPEAIRKERERLYGLVEKRIERNSAGDNNAPVAIIGSDGKPLFVTRKEALGKRPASAVELPPLAGSQLSSAGAQIASGMTITQVIPGYGRNVADRRESARMEAINQIKAGSPGMTDAQAGQELANRGIDLQAGRRSVVQLNTMLGATRQAVDQLDFNVKKVTEQMDKLGGSDISPVVNAMARGAQKWTGDPAYSALFYYMHASAMESARILQGGQASIAQLHQGAAEEAKKWADANYTTPKAWKEGVAPAMMAEGQERLRTYERAIEKQRLGGAGAKPAAPDDLQKLVDKYKTKK